MEVKRDPRQHPAVRGGAGLALCLAAALSACSSAPSVLPTQSLEHYALRDVRGEVQIAVDPYATPDRTRDAFTGGEEFVERGLLPVRVLIENGSSGPVRMDPADAMLITTRGQVPSLTVDEALAVVKVPVGWWALGGGFVGGSAPAYRNETRRRDLDGRALKAVTVPPGGSAGGFLYFSLPENELSLAGNRILLAIRDAAGRAGTFQFTLEGRREIAAPVRAARGAAAAAAPPAPGQPRRVEGTGGRGIIIRSP
jgi:hypothetical protein